MNDPKMLEGRPANRFEKRANIKEWCDGCNDEVTRLSQHGWHCATCEAYHAHYDALMQGYAVVLRAWQERHGLTLEQTLQIAREFDGMYEAVQVFLMDGYTFGEYIERRELEADEPEKTEAVTPPHMRSKE